MWRDCAKDVQDAPSLLEGWSCRLTGRSRLGVGTYWCVSATAPYGRVGRENGGGDKPCEESADDNADDDGERRRYATDSPRWLHGRRVQCQRELVGRKCGKEALVAERGCSCLFCLWARTRINRRRRRLPTMSSSSASSSPSMPPVLLCPPQKSDPSPLLQRRPAKNSAFIAPPTPGIPPSAILSSADKHPSRLNQRTLGLPNRIWLILSLFLAILVFTRLVLPSHSPDASYYLRHHSPSYAASLHPINYLNLSDADTEAAQNPFPFCPTFGKGDDLSEKYGPLAISKSWFHLGSGARVQQVIHRALLGQPVTISVIGGSSEHIQALFITLCLY